MHSQLHTQETNMPIIPLDEIIVTPSAAFEHVTGRTEVFDGDDGEAENTIVEHAQNLNEHAAKVLYDAGMIDQANAIITIINATNARDYALLKNNG
jgi:hypothetical protein